LGDFAAIMGILLGLDIWKILMQLEMIPNLVLAIHHKWRNTFVVHTSDP
jgi:hypothetical protein